LVAQIPNLRQRGLLGREVGRRPDLAGGTVAVPGRRGTGGASRARQGKSKKARAKATRCKRATPRGAHEARANKKAEFIVIMKRAKGTTLGEIMEVTLT